MVVRYGDRMSTEWKFDAEVEWKKVQDARVPWIELKNRVKAWPGWVRKLDVKLQAWLHGEKVVYAEYGCTLNGELYEGTAIDADGLNAFILTERSIIVVSVTKSAGSDVVSNPVVLAGPRSSITSLAAEVVELPGAQDLPFVTRVQFAGIDGEIQIPADSKRWDYVSQEDRLAIFTSLREDRFGYRA